MKAKLALLALVSLAMTQPAWAQEPAQTHNSRVVLGGGITVGGDTVFTAFYTDGTRKELKAGQLFHLYGGLEYQFQEFAVQGNIGYHVDQAIGSNGDVIFGRIPLELIAYRQLGEKARIGLGIRKALNPKVEARVDSIKTQFDLTSELGTIIEGEWLLSKQFGLKLRYVMEEYKYGSFKFDGNHWGVMANLYF